MTDNTARPAAPKDVRRMAMEALERARNQLDPDCFTEENSASCLQGVNAALSALREELAAAGAPTLPEPVRTAEQPNTDTVHLAVNDGAGTDGSEGREITVADQFDKLRQAVKDARAPIGNMDPDGRMKALTRRIEYQQEAINSCMALLDAYDELRARGVDASRGGEQG